MESTLSTMYETLKWIENAAADLNYEVEEVEKMLESKMQGRALY